MALVCRSRKSAEDESAASLARLARLTFDNTFRRKSNKDKERDLLSSYYRRATGFAGSASSYVDSALLESDSEDCTFPLFQDTSASDQDMDTRPGLMNTATSSNAFNSPRRHHTSNLTSALQSTSGNETTEREFGGKYGIGIIMQGSSPFPQQSPSFHSSSYIPKLEANFMRDFCCCGLIMASLHELLQHYEENHTESPQSRTTANPPTALPDTKAAIASNTANAVRQSAQQQQSVQQANPVQSDQKSAAAHTPSNPATPKLQKAQPVTTGNLPASQHHPSLDMDAVQDMEMDDVDYNPQPQPTENNAWGLPNQPRMMPRSQFGQPAASRVPPLDTSTMNMANHLQQHQGLRKSTPTTPVTASRNGNFYQNNPTVSSVNTPTLVAHPAQKQTCIPTPDSSAPGTPGELQEDFVGNLGQIYETMSMSNGQDFARNQFGGFGNFQFGNGNEMLDLCIDEPAKRLFSANGCYNSNSNGGQMSNAARLGDAQYSENSELARTIREQQRLAGIPDGGSGPNDGVPKPFHCPVIGCEKAYKNQNGLKYHKAHGHNTQQLHANENGTFSIVDPETLNPYPGTLGMEKHKPYRCNACGKRYKNLNGLKYHKNHSVACQSGKQPVESIDTSTTEPNTHPATNPPNLAQDGFNDANVSGMDTGINANIDSGFPGGGPPAVDEEMMM
ncbi:MAG: hypothetical protein Q9201_002834 [Fulgogasparrea decipioides]